MKPAPREQLVLLLPDGTVDSVEGGAPTTWVGRSLSERDDVPLPLRLAAEVLLHAPPSSTYFRRRHVRLEEEGDTPPTEIELILLEALPLRRSYTRVGDLLLRTLDAFMLQAGASDVDLHVEKSPDVPEVLLLDGEKIAWALATLVGNALRYARPRDGQRGHVRVRIDWHKSESELVIRVKDNGPGMPAGKARWLFDRDPATGTAAGLALVMVRDVMVAHRGSIAVESALGHGTTFTMHLPRTIPPQT